MPFSLLSSRIESAIHKRLEWTETQHNGEQLWCDIRAMVSDYLFTLFRQGALTGSCPEEAYFVRCDRTTTTQADVDRRSVNILIGYAPVHPAEFVTLRITRPTAAVHPSMIFHQSMRPQPAS